MIEKDRIKANLESFSVPRLSGSEAEEDSFELLKEKIGKLNLNPITQKFVFSSFYSRVYPKLSLTILFAILFVFVFRIQGEFTVPFVSVSIIFLILLLIFTRNPERITFGKKFHSQNVFVKLESKNNKNVKSDTPWGYNTSPNIFLFSHLDSKGQRFTIRVRVISVWLWIISILLGFTVNVMVNIFFQDNNLLFQIIKIILLSTNFIATLIIVLNTTNNNSNGAIDNASGVACVFEILNFFQSQDNRLENYNLWFVFTGAEECGTMGIRNFYQYMKNLDRSNNFTMNFDTICNRIYIYNHNLITNSNLRTLSLISEKEEFMELKKSKFFYPGIRSDGLYLLRKHFTGIGMGDETVYSYVHSIEDTVDKINVSVIEDLCNLITVLLSEIDNK